MKRTVSGGVETVQDLRDLVALIDGQDVDGAVRVRISIPQAHQLDSPGPPEIEVSW